MRPFYVLINTSNRKHTLGAGPAGKPGWFNTHVLAEVDGASKRILSIESYKPIDDTRTVLVSVPGLGTIVIDARQKTWRVDLDDGHVIDGRLFI